MDFFTILIFGLYLALADGNITLRAKFLGNMKVEGDSYSVYALSVSHCLAMCNKNKSCDAITFNDENKKCRLFKRCAPLEIIVENSHHWFYAKRPPDSGYFYEQNSDTCLKLTKDKLPYYLANELCLKDKGYLAVLHSAELMQLAQEMLQDSDITEAWINPPFRSYEKYAKNHALRKKRRVDLKENKTEIDDCWLVNNVTLAKECSCKDETRQSICQLPTY